MCIYARSKDRSNIEGISNALELLTRDQLHIVFLQILLRRNRKSRNRAVGWLKRLHLYFTYAGFVILAVEEEVVVVFFLLFRHFLTYASIRCAIFLGLISPVLLWHICNQEHDTFTSAFHRNCTSTILTMLLSQLLKFSVYLRYSFAHNILVFFLCNVLFGVMGFEN
jgi:hypothetical protein